MKRTFTSLLTVVGAITVLALLGNSIAFAATGSALVLGKVNKANKATVIKRTTSGPALSLVTKPSTSAPFAVNSRGKVANLNADSLDGLDSSTFASAASVATLAAQQPVATGDVSAGGGGTSPSLVRSTGTTSVAWNEANHWYEITLTDVTYTLHDFQTVVTSACNNGLSSAVSEIDGKVLVAFGAGVPTCVGGFTYMVYKLG